MCFDLLFHVSKVGFCVAPHTGIVRWSSEHANYVNKIIKWIAGIINTWSRTLFLNVHSIDLVSCNIIMMKRALRSSIHCSLAILLNWSYIYTTRLQNKNEDIIFFIKYVLKEMHKTMRKTAENKQRTVKKILLNKSKNKVRLPTLNHFHIISVHLIK